MPNKPNAKRRGALYRAWAGAKRRCRNPGGKKDPIYYKGITFCTAWDIYEDFAKDVGPHPGNGWTIDRIDNSKGYEPGNVRWATRQTQSRNRPAYVIGDKIAAEIRAEYATGKATHRSIAAKHGVCQGTVYLVVSGRTWA